MADARIELARLVDVPLDEVVALLNEPRNTRHMPLSTPFTPETARHWAQAKDAQWAEHGYGPWAVLVDGDFAGWGGFQREPNGADFALVLLPRHWGSGAAIAREVLDRGFTEFGLTDVLIALPYSRSPDRAVARLGFRPDGDVDYGAVAFRQYRLTRAAWAEARGPA
jgi:ribosomal-protein-alanine N-acetyltransferase